MTPFEHALVLAWADEKMTATEFQQLDILQETLNISDSERAEIELLLESNLLSIGAPIPSVEQGSLSKFIDSVRALTSADPEISSGLAKRLGGTALRSGITQAGWKSAYIWMEQLGLAKPFAEGCWLIGDLPPALTAVPLALAPVAKSLNLVD
ncbi:MAG: hypothetical protein VYA86_00150 [Candidatus Thermoplasmatota archaeon]|nr:hypothetical protein [Candidatus Thermoplasmatota archaeon]